MTVINCPECNGDITLGANAVEGETVTCPGCNVHLEIVSLHPQRVDVAPMESEDWGDK